ncbi:MAG: phytanoyl-CoA dioxygenase family protein [SAR324 cluster bacterium]|nr:phytanoyl-CoA dioxygenase family protein [SAR324 cluster bacterium]
MSLVTPEIKKEFDERGFAVIPDVLSTSELEAYRRVFDCCVRDKDRELDERGVSEDGITLKGKRYFIHFPHRKYPELEHALFNENMAGICRSILGDQVYLYWDQCVIKYKDEESYFAWHQDSGYGGVKDHARYLTCWIALDDVHEANGTVYMLPWDRVPCTGRIEHYRSEKYKALVGYEGDDPGDPVIMKAGSIAIFTSHTLHHSGANTCNEPRRVYYTAYSKELIYRKEDNQMNGVGTPFIKNGKRVTELTLAKQ